MFDWLMAVELANGVGVILLVIILALVVLVVCVMRDIK